MLIVAVGLWMTITPGLEKISRPSFCHLKINDPADKSPVKEEQVSEPPPPSCHTCGVGVIVGLGSSKTIQQKMFLSTVYSGI